MFLFGPPNVKNMKARRDVQGLIKALSYQKDSDVRKAAAQALGQIGDARAVELLVAALKDESGYVRSAAADALGQIGDARAVEALVATLKDDEYQYVRAAAARSLGQIGDPRAIEPLVAALRLWEVSEAAALSLDLLGWQPGRDENAARYWIAKQEWEKCAALGSVATETCISLLEQSARTGSFAQSMLNMDRFSHPAAGWGIIGQMLGNECIKMREAAVKVLVSIGASAVQPLIDALQDQSTWMRMTVAWALGELKDPRAVEPLVALLKDKNALQGGDCLCDCPRQAVVEALVKIGAPAVPLLIAALKDKNEHVRRAVAKALESLGVSTQ